MTATIKKLAQTEDDLHETAVRMTGFDDFGNSTYRQGLHVLLEAFDTDLHLTKTGFESIYRSILDILIARLYTQKGWAEHPEVLSIPIQRPLIITGIPRTGTTALHRLLALDPQFQGLELWLSQRPMIRPPRETWELCTEYRTCVASLESLYTHTPELRKVHEFVAGEVEECARLLAQNFVCHAWVEAASLPTYARWFLSQSVQESYHRYVNVLRLIGAREPHKRWLLKTPGHMAEIDTLLKVFPDACIIQTHRDPLKAVPSFCDMLYVVGRGLEGEAARPDIIGPQQCSHWSNALDRMQAARQSSPMQFFDVEHRHFVTDPLGVVNLIYEYFGLILSPHTERQMRKWVAASPTSRHGKHQYSTDLWGVNTTQIRHAFADYRAQHKFD